MEYRSHRGGVYYTPENTMPAFYDAIEKGFKYIETDPCYTKDGRIILMPDATITYDGPATDDMLKKVSERVKYENLYVWTYMDKPNFDWLEKTRKVSAENCARIKRYARLGIGNINNPYDVYEALSYNPDLIEV